MKIAVIMGGHESEHERSLKSGQTALRTLSAYAPLPVIISEDLQTWHLKQPMSAPDALAYLASDVDVALLMLHGPYGEGGTLQGALEAIGLPYTGSDVFASTTATSKSLSGLLFEDAELKTPEFVSFTKHDVEQYHTSIEALGFPLVVKPENGSPSEGVSFVNSWGEFLYAIYSSSTTDIIAQEYIDGLELTCSVFDVNGQPVASQVTERTVGSSAFVPADITIEAAANIQRMAVKAHRLLGCSGVSQSNFILNDHVPYVLGINTSPYMEEPGVVTQQLKEAGLTLDDFFIKMCQRAYDKRRRNFKTVLSNLYQRQSSSVADVASALRQA